LSLPRRLSARQGVVDCEGSRLGQGSPKHNLDVVAAADARQRRQVVRPPLWRRRPLTTTRAAMPDGAGLVIPMPRRTPVTSIVLSGVSFSGFAFLDGPVHM